jgi:hypothetical protein
MPAQSSTILSLVDIQYLLSHAIRDTLLAQARAANDSRISIVGRGIKGNE